MPPASVERGALRLHQTPEGGHWAAELAGSIAFNVEETTTTPAQLDQTTTEVSLVLERIQSMSAGLFEVLGEVPDGSLDQSGRTPERAEISNTPLRQRLLPLSARGYRNC